MNVENESSEFTQHKIPRNDGTNYADYLLSNVEVRCIAVDAGNRNGWVPLIMEYMLSAMTVIQK